MSIYSNDNISKIAKLTTRELPQKSKNAKITVRENNGLYSMQFVQKFEQSTLCLQYIKSHGKIRSLYGQICKQGYSYFTSYHFLPYIYLGNINF